MKKGSFTQLIFLLLFIPCSLDAQIPLYISKQTGEKSSYSGSRSKTTDQYESGSVNIVVEGPVEYTLTPNQTSIGPEETVHWQGSVRASGTAPAPGNSADAKIKGNYNVTYSRVGDGTGPDVVSTYTSTNEDGEEVTHEIVNKTGTESRDFKVYSIKVKMDAPHKVCKGDTVKLKATGYPDVGYYDWSNGKTGEEIELKLNNTKTFKVTYSIEEVTYSDQKQVLVFAPGSWEVQASQSAEIPSTIMDKINYYKNAIPGGDRLNLNKGEYSLAMKVRDCCHDGQVKTAGETMGEGSITVGIEGEDIPIPSWSVPVSVYGSVAGNSFGLEINVGAFWNWNVTLTGTGGKRVNMCVPEECLYGQVGLGASVMLKLKCEAMACIDTWFTSEQCGGIDIEPASISASTGGDIKYDECTGLQMNAYLGKVVATINIPLPGPDYTWNYTITNGIQLYP